MRRSHSRESVEVVEQRVERGEFSAMATNAWRTDRHRRDDRSDPSRHTRSRQHHPPTAASRGIAQKAMSRGIDSPCRPDDRHRGADLIGLGGVTVLTGSLPFR
jgi:hypothetical protein